MESTPVNYEALDSLVIDFAKSENLIEDRLSSTSPLSSPSPSPPPSSSSVSSSSYHSTLIIRKIRRCLEAGDIDSATDLLRSHAAFIVDDHRLLFRLQKQLLRTGAEEARDAAIECIRTALAPCALDAYPEAYEEFKHVLLAFIYDKDDRSSPVANEIDYQLNLMESRAINPLLVCIGAYQRSSLGVKCSERRRFDIAGMMSSDLRAHLHAYDPVFSMTLRYLTRKVCMRHLRLTRWIFRLLHRLWNLQGKGQLIV